MRRTQTALCISSAQTHEVHDRGDTDNADNADNADRERQAEEWTEEWTQLHGVTQSADIERQTDNAYGRAVLEWASQLVVEARRQTDEVMQRATALVSRAERLMECTERCADAVAARLDAVDRELDNVRFERTKTKWLLEEMQGIAENIVQREIERSRAALVCIVRDTAGRQQ